METKTRVTQSDIEELVKKYEEKENKYQEDRRKLSKLEVTAEISANRAQEELNKVNPKLLDFLGIKINKSLMEMEEWELIDFQNKLQQAQLTLFSKIKHYLDTGEAEEVKSMLSLLDLGTEQEDENIQMEISNDMISDITALSYGQGGWCR